MVTNQKARLVEFLAAEGNEDPETTDNILARLTQTRNSLSMVQNSIGQTMDTVQATRDNIGQTINSVHNFDARWKEFQDSFDEMSSAMLESIEGVLGQDQVIQRVLNQKLHGTGSKTKK